MVYPLDITVTFLFASMRNWIGFAPKVIACPRNGIEDGMWGGNDCSMWERGNGVGVKRGKGDNN